MVGTAGDDEDGHWRADFEPEEHRTPRVTEPSTPLETGNEEVNLGVAQPQEEGLGLSLIWDTARPAPAPDRFPRVSLPAAL